MPFAGPTGHPKFEMKNWKELNIKYWVVTNTTNAAKWEETERTLHISGTDIDGLRKVFITKSSKGTAQGSVRPWVLKIDTNDEWCFELVSPDSLFFCNVSNVERAYFVKTSSTDFYEQLKEVCFQNEKRMTPDILIDNIRICRRFGGNRPPQEKIVAYTGKIPPYLSSGTIEEKQSESVGSYPESLREP
ncbi:hypothetical protein FACS1894214_4240 [Planctomycetales bacterium]|nr:hypothetical protein FACS1894214_4240 [Planctomycetales bacterium]